MIKLLKEAVTEGTKSRELGVINRMFERIFDRSDTIPFTVREFVNATSGAVSRYLPDGNTNPDKDYYYMKTDSSVNAVTIYPYDTQTINGAASYVLAAQYDRLWLGWNKATQMWHILQ